MKIKVLRVTNLKKVKHVEIAPVDNVIVIAGKNASGKTSVLDAIYWGMTGKKGMKGVSKPIREGEKEAEIVLELDNFIVERRFKDNKTMELVVIDKEYGIEPKSPQSILDNFIGELSLDPLEFTLLNPKEQRDLLLKALGLKEELEKIDEKKKYLYDKRTIIGRDVKTYEGQLKGLESPEKDLPKKIISISDLSKKLEKIKDYNDELERDKKNLEETLKAIENYKTKIEELETLLNKEEDKEFWIREKIKGKKPKDLNVIREKIEKAESINEKIREAGKYKAISDIIVGRKYEVKKLTGEISNFDKSKLKLLKSKKMPIKGLSIDEEGVNYNNIPFNQLASSEQLKVSISMAMAMNPKLRVIRITDGSLLDDDNMKVIEEMAKKFDYQIWLERVAIDKFADIILVDGEIENR